MRRRWLLIGLVLLVTVLLLHVFWDFARHVLLPELWSVVQVVRIVFNK